MAGRRQLRGSLPLSTTIEARAGVWGMTEIAAGFALGGQRKVNKAPRARSNTPEDIRLNDAAPPGLPSSRHRPVVHS